VTAIGKAKAKVRQQVSAGLDGSLAPIRQDIIDLIHHEMGELARMLRQQGDASDEVAETLGRSLARLGAEIDVLSKAVERLEDRLAAEDLLGKQDTPA
jgi:hypothetical protein